MDDLERTRGAFIAEATARFVATGTRAREHYRAELRTIRKAVSNLPDAEIEPLRDALRDRAVKLDQMAWETTREGSNFKLTGVAGVGGIALLLTSVLTGGASLAAGVAVGTVAAVGSRLAIDAGEGLKSEGETLRAAAQDLRELAQTLGEGGRGGGDE